ncbi:MAG: hypothetical protein ABR600_05990 [Actinomycetota bacterium]|nr:glycoside hydrolase [Actinomycetota bacterium]
MPIPEGLSQRADRRLGLDRALNVPLTASVTQEAADGSDVAAAPPASNPRNEPSVAVSPLDPNLVVSSSNDYNGSGVNAGAYYSTDGGRTFKGGTFMARAPSTDVAGDPALAYDSQGHLYFSYLDTNQNFALGKGGMFVERSEDGGVTWPTKATKFAANSNGAAGCIFQDKEYITVDQTPEQKPDGTTAPRDWLFASWTEYHLGGSACDGYTGSPVYATRSVDGGKTFSAPVMISPSITDKTMGSIPKVAPDGTLYVAYDSTRPDMTKVCPTYAVTSGGATAGQSAVEDMVVARSTDGGQTFARSTAFAGACDAAYPTMFGGTYRQNSIPTFDIDPKNGALVVAWPNDDVYGQDIHTRISTDGGQTWSDGGTLGFAGDVLQFPWLAFGPDGTLYMDYLKQGPGGTFTPMLVTSTNDGRTWSTAVQLSSATSVGDDPAFEGQFDGDYLALAVGSDRVAHAVWTDIRSPYPLGTQNIWTRRITP